MINEVKAKTSVQNSGRVFRHDYPVLGMRKEFSGGEKAVLAPYVDG